MTAKNIGLWDLVRHWLPVEPTLNIIGSRDEQGQLHLQYLHDPSCPAWKIDTTRCWCAQTVLVAGKGTFVDIENFLSRLRDVEETQ